MVEGVEIPGGWHRRGGGSSALPSFLLCLFHWLLICPFVRAFMIGECWPFLGSVDRSCTAIKPEEGSWEPPIYSQSVRSTGHNVGLTNDIGSGGAVFGTEPSTCEVGLCPGSGG